MARTAAARTKPRNEARLAPRGNVFVGRDGEELTRNREIDISFVSQYDIPDRLREVGWAMQWVRASAHNQTDASNITRMHEAGWRTVPVARPGFQEYFRTQGQNDIVRDGLVLMERPEAMNEQASEDDFRAAVDQRHVKSEEFTAGFELPAGFKQGYGKAKSGVRREIEGVPLDTYPSRQIALGGDEDEE